jgi:hypothetical protein
MNLEEIKHRFAGTDIRFSMSRMDFDWLIAEAEAKEKAEAEADKHYSRALTWEEKARKTEAELSACKERVEELEKRAAASERILDSMWSR